MKINTLGLFYKDGYRWILNKKYQVPGTHVCVIGTNSLSTYQAMINMGRCNYIYGPQRKTLKTAKRDAVELAIDKGVIRHERE